MTTILVPVDFSEGARRALRFAREFQQKLNARIEVIFYYHPYFDAADPNRLSPNNEIQKIHRKSMDSLMEEEGLPMENGTVLMGYPADSLIELSKKVDLIIMGARGEHGTLEKIFGTVSSNVGLNAHCPVLIIPENAPEIHKINRLVYGLEFPFSSEPTIQKVAKFATDIEADLHFVHVDEEDQTRTDEELKQMHADIAKLMPHKQDFHLVTILGDEEILEALEKYATEKEGDLLVLVARGRKWWQRLFLPNRTKKLALETDMPLLVLHAE